MRLSRVGYGPAPGRDRRRIMTAGANRQGARSPAPAPGLLMLLVVLVLAIAAPGLSRPALAQNTATAPQSGAAQPGLTPEEARRALEVLQNDARRRDVITTLEAIARSAREGRAIALD